MLITFNKPVSGISETGTGIDRPLHIFRLLDYELLSQLKNYTKNLLHLFVCRPLLVFLLLTMRPLVALAIKFQVQGRKSTFRAKSSAIAQLKVWIEVVSCFRVFANILNKSRLRDLLSKLGEM